MDCARMVKFGQIAENMWHKGQNTIQQSICGSFQAVRQTSSMKKPLNPVSPGEMLAKEFLAPIGMTKYRLAKSIGVPAQRIGDIIAGKRGITADTDLRLCRFFGLTDGWWLRLQASHDTVVAKRALADELAMIVPFERAA
jgi:antitoxin HigA-1